MQTIYLDISNKGVIPVIYAKQGDVGRKVEVVLTNSGLPYEPEAGSTFSAWYSGASGMGNYTDIGEKSAFSVSNNKVTVELIAQMLQNAGEGFLCLVLSRANGDEIGLWNIRYVCEGIPGAGSDPAKDYYTAFSQAVADLAYPDSSLSAAGKAADAAAVGTALAGKAPAGYGLGENSGRQPHTEDLNEITTIGFWAMPGGNAVNYPDKISYSGYGSLLVERRTDKITQTVKFNGYIAVRSSGDNGVSWEDWKYVNPPMELGVEYRTTERWNGKAVYTKLIDFGALPNAGKKTVNHGIANIEHALSIEMTGKMESGWCATLPNDFTQLTALAFDKHSVSVTTATDWSGFNAYATVKYTKD